MLRTRIQSDSKSLSSLQEDELFLEFLNRWEIFYSKDSYVKPYLLFVLFPGLKWGSLRLFSLCIETRWDDQVKVRLLSTWKLHFLHHLKNVNWIGFKTSHNPPKFWTWVKVRLLSTWKLHFLHHLKNVDWIGFKASHTSNLPKFWT